MNWFTRKRISLLVRTIKPIKYYFGVSKSVFSPFLNNFIESQTHFIWMKYLLSWVKTAFCFSGFYLFTKFAIKWIAFNELHWVESHECFFFSSLFLSPSLIHSWNFNIKVNWMGDSVSLILIVNKLYNKSHLKCNKLNGKLCIGIDSDQQNRINYRGMFEWSWNGLR